MIYLIHVIYLMYLILSDLSDLSDVYPTRCLYRGHPLGPLPFKEKALLTVFHFPMPLTKHLVGLDTSVACR